MNKPASVKDADTVYCSVAGHKNEKIIFFCFTNNCWTPLCQECIQMHREYHEETNEVVDLKPFLVAKEETEKSIRKNMGHVDERIAEIEKIILGDINQINHDLQSLSRSRNLLLSLVNDYFNEIELEYKRLVVDKYRKKESLAQKMMAELSSLKGKLKEHLGQLNVSSLCLEIIEKTNLSNATLDIEKIFKIFLDSEIEDKKCQVRVNSDLISDFRNTLKEYMKIEQNSSIYLSFANSMKSPEIPQSAFQRQKTSEGQIIFESQIEKAKDISGNTKSAETAAGTLKVLLTKSVEPEDTLAKSSYSAEWEKTINSKESQTRSGKKLKKLKKKAAEHFKQDDSLLQSEEQKNEDHEAEEIMTEHTVYSSDTDTAIHGFAENQSNADSSVISELSENAGFEEINMSPTANQIN